MEQQQRQQVMISDFTNLLYSKGYRGQYCLNDQREPRPQAIYPLSRCLQEFMDIFQKNKGHASSLRLATYADPSSKNFLCAFYLHIDEVMGFKVKKMQITNLQTSHQQLYRMLPIMQIPGAASVEALFPNPRPWDDLIRGKGFRMR